ncbi:MAG: PKD domain-containing protein [Chitinophagaceae bacterium]|nr:PKD domain-containing protein [Chitinophagaceae bacterium]
MKFNSNIFLFFSCLFCTLPALAQQPVEFVENKGQWDNSVLFKGEITNGAFFLQREGFTVLLNNQDDMQKIAYVSHGHLHENIPATPGTEASKRSAYPRPGTKPPGPDDSLVLRSHAYNMRFSGSNPNPVTEKEKPVSSYANYLLGNDPSKWASECKIYQAVTYKNIYPNIDVRYYANGSDLKYDIVVYPGANVNNIVMTYEGADKLLIKNKELIIKTSVGDVKELAPYSYQLNDQGKTEVDCKYVIEEKNTVKFKIRNYDPSAILVIDPTLIFSTFTGSQADQWGFTATYGANGSLYSGGIVFGSGFPVSPGAFQTNFGGGGGSRPFDIGIMKFNKSGSVREYATYIGGSGEDQPHSLIEDSHGNLVILGRTNSPLNGSGAYPLLPSGNTEGPCGSYDIVVTKLNASGSNLVGSKRMGGTGNDGVNVSADRSGPSSIKLFYGDDSRSEVIVDASDNIYFVGSTQSTSGTASSRFPTTTGAAQSTPGGAQDGVVAKLSPDVNTLIFSTFLGGGGDDGAYVLALNPVNNNLYVAGTTKSSAGLPGVPSSGVVGPSYRGGEMDGFISIFSNSGSLQKTTYVGTNSLDAIYGIKFDPSGYPYITGVTLGSWNVYPSGIYSNPNSKQFIVKLSTDLSTVIYSTVYGNGSPRYNISPIAFAVDKCENVYVGGWGGRLTPNAPDPFRTAGTLGMPTRDCNVLPNGCATDGNDFYFFVLEKNAQNILFGAFFGLQGGWGDHVDGGTSRFDETGIIYQAMCAACFIGSNPPSPFPTTPGVWSPKSGNSRACNLAAIKIEMDFSGVINGVRPSIEGVPNKNYGCAPLTVDFVDTLQRGKMYIWDFGDGHKDTTTTPRTSYTYNNLGNYQVSLITVDSSKCVMADTSYTNIRVRQDRAIVDWDYNKFGPCASLGYQFHNNSVAPPGKPFTNTSFQWDFGDGSPPIIVGNGVQTHHYAAPGTYNVILTLLDTNYCNGPDSDTMLLRIATTTKAIFETDPSGCVPHTAVFNNVSEGGRTYFWDFGDGATSTDFAPVHEYTSVGTYTVRLVVTDPNTCNVVDETTRIITVHGRPTAGFTFSPVQPEENTPASFTNTSIGAVRYTWEFGDGDTSVLVNPVHQYNRTDTYNVCLIAYNEHGCADTICQPVPALVSPLIAVPTAFSPNGDGVNDYVYVRGYAIQRMVFRIYNRWGQLVFQTNDPNKGWDGKYKGVLQPMDAYAYTLEVEYSDGTRASRKGDITLLR